MSLRQVIAALVADERGRLAPATAPEACSLCRAIARVERVGHRHWVQRDDDDEAPTPLFERLRCLVHFGDGSDYELRVCPACGTLYYYCFKGRTVQLSFSSNDSGEYNPAEEWCTPGTADEVIELVFDNYDVKSTRFKRVVKDQGRWLVTTSSKPVGDDDVVL